MPNNTFPKQGQKGSVLRSGKNLERWQTGGSGISVNIFSDVLETDTGDPMLSVL